MANEILIRVRASDDASKTFDQVSKSAGGFGSTLQKVGTIAAGFVAANVVAGGVQKLTGFMSDSIEAAKESIQVNAQLDAVLKSTGHAAGLTADQIKNLASSLEKQSLFEDEAILKGQNLLLTFTNIKDAADGSSQVFTDATAIMLDMAQAMGTDASGSAIQLGKALNDPVAGITALTRVGVTFSEEQKKMIAALVKTGDVAGAQNIILAELNKEFGGSAKAASDAAGKAEVYKDKMNDLKETIGAKLLPVQLKFKEIQIEIIDYMVSKVIPVLEELYAKHWPAVQKALQDVGAVLVNDLWPAFRTGVETIAPAMEAFVNFILDHKVVLIAAIVAIGIAIVAAMGPVSTAFLAITAIITLLGLLKREIDAVLVGLGLVEARRGSAGPTGVNTGTNAATRAAGTVRDPFDGAFVSPGELAMREALRRDPNSEFYIPGYASGTSFVPRTGLALLHRGEAVVPASENRAGMGGMSGVSVTINNPVIYARDEADAERSMGDAAYGLAAALRSRGLAVA